MKAVGIDQGREIEKTELKTAGPATAIKLIPDRSTIRADGQDLSFIKVKVLDQDGNLQPNADELINFRLSGPGTIAGLGNAWLKSTDPYQGSTCHVYHGQGLIVLRATESAGCLKLQAHSGHLLPDQIEITTR